MRGWLVCCIALLGVLVACSDGKEKGNRDVMSWPLFRGNAKLSGYTSLSLPDRVDLLWTYKTATRTVSSPVVKSSVTYWCDKKGRIHGVDLEGKSVFEFDMDTNVEATPMIDDSVLYIGRIDGYLTAISLSKGDSLWNFETLGQISASPNVTDFKGTRAVVVGSYDNYLYCLDTANGQELNRFESGYYINGAVALWKKHVIFGGCDSWLRMVDCETGALKDSILLDAYIPASPACFGQYCYVGDYSGNIYEIELSAEQGFLNSRKLLKSDEENGSFVSVPAVDSGNIYVLSGDRYLYAINRVDGEKLWRYLLKGQVGESSPVVCDGKVLICTKTGIVSILDAVTGELLWEYDTGEQIIGSPAVIKDHFLVLSSKGTLFCFGKGRKK